MGDRPLGGLAAHTQAPRHRWRSGRHCLGRDGTCAAFHPGHQWKESRGLRGLPRGFLTGPSPGANNRAGSSSSSAAGKRGCTSPSLRSIPWQHGQGQAGSTQGHGNWSGCRLVLPKVLPLWSLVALRPL